MAELEVRTAELTLTTVKLSAKILKQIPRIDYRTFRQYTGEGEDAKSLKCVVGWIHGSVIDNDGWQKWMLIRTGEGSYALYNAGDDFAKHYKQIYVA